MYNPPTASHAGAQALLVPSLFLNSVELLGQTTALAFSATASSLRFVRLSHSSHLSHFHTKKEATLNHERVPIFSPRPNRLIFLEVAALTAKWLELFATLPGDWPNWRIIPRENKPCISAIRLLAWA